LSFSSVLVQLLGFYRLFLSSVLVSLRFLLTQSQCGRLTLHRRARMSVAGTVVCQGGCCWLWDPLPNIWSKDDRSDSRFGRDIGVWDVSASL